MLNEIVQERLYLMLMHQIITLMFQQKDFVIEYSQMV